jgi:preprotein translocase subunit SecA
MGQKDPLTEWQREGFEMFGAMMSGIAQDFVRYVMHVQVVRNEEQTPSAAPSPIANVTTNRADEPVVNRLRQSGAAPSSAPGSAPGSTPGAVTASSSAVDWSKTPRNAPCPCGSGKKYKQCHGKA